MLSELKIPTLAFLLGWMGVIPFAVFTTCALAGVPFLQIDPVWGLRAYGACILSFMGGVQWGIALQGNDNDARTAPRYIVSVIPALVACGCLFLPASAGLLGLITGFVALLAYDLLTVGQGAAPRWYGRLRIQLTSAVVVLLGIAIFTL